MTMHHLSLRKFIVLLAIFTFHPSVASAARFSDSHVIACGALLVKGEIEAPPVLEATLFHLFTEDFPVFYTDETRRMVFDAVTVTHAPIERNASTRREIYYATGLLIPYQIGNRYDLGAYPALVQALEQGRLTYDAPKMNDVVAQLWGRLRKRYLPGEIAGSIGIGDLMDTIEGHPKLKEAMFSVLRKVILRTDGWLPERGGLFWKQWDKVGPSDFRIGRGNRRKIIASMRKEFEAEPLPTLAADIGAPVESLLASSPDLSGLAASFREGVDPNRLDTAEGIIYFDRDLWKNLHFLNVLAGDVRDDFARTANWKSFYDSGAAWRKLADRATPRSKRDFLASLASVRNFVDAQSRSIQALRHTLQLAEENLVAKIALLKARQAELPVNSELSPEVASALERLGRARTEIENLKKSFDGWRMRLSEGDAALVELQAWAGSSGSVVKDADEFRAIMKRIQVHLDLDPILNKRFEGFWSRLF